MVKARTVALLGGLVAAGTASYFIIAAQAKTSGGGQETVSVTVTDGSLGSAVPYVGVTIDLQSSVTNAQGVATFQGVSDGPHTLSVNASGYKMYTESINVGPYSTTFTAPLIPCMQQLCGLGQKWDPVLCQCENLVASYISTPPSAGFRQNWYVHAGLCAGTTPGGDPGCNGTCGSNESGVIIQVKVTASDGSPVPGLAVQGSLSIDTLYWRTSDGCTSGHFSLSLAPAIATTDGFGIATFTVVYQIVVDSTCGGFCPFCCGPGVASGSFQVNMVTEVLGTQIKGLTTVTMYSGVYTYAYHTL